MIESGPHISIQIDLCIYVSKLDIISNTSLKLSQIQNIESSCIASQYLYQCHSNKINTKSMILVLFVYLSLCLIAQHDLRQIYIYDIIIIRLICMSETFNGCDKYFKMLQWATIFSLECHISIQYPRRLVIIFINFFPRKQFPSIFYDFIKLH